MIDDMPESVDQNMVRQLADALAIWGNRYRLLCGRCWKDSRLQSRKTTREAAGEHFYGQGWQFAGGIAVCPKCAKKSN